jgi:haloalkane dehalogenase
MTQKLDRRQLVAAGVAAAALPALDGQAQEPTITSAWGRNKQYVEVRGLKMAYAEMGEGEPKIVFLHGNPTSSFLWRNIMPHVAHLGHCIAPDMLGMGDSDPLPDSGPGRYTFINQRDYLFEMFDALELGDEVIFVIHDWGSAMGFSWAMQHAERVKGIAYMESIVRPQQMQEADTGGGFFGMLRSPEGERLVLEENMFVERLFIGGLEHYLTEEEKNEYRRPYLEPGESRRPTLTWPRELPLGGTPEVNDQIIAEYSAWLATETAIPKLLVHAEPGAIFRAPPMLEFVRSFQNQTEVSVYGGHFVQEVSPDAIGRALADWIADLS